MDLDGSQIWPIRKSSGGRRARCSFILGQHREAQLSLSQEVISIQEEEKAYCKDTLVARAADKMVDKPWMLCDTSKGFDCLNFLLFFYEDMGFVFPDQFEGVTRKTYAELWKSDNQRAKEIMKRFLFSVGDEINPHYMLRGDLLIFEGKEFGSFPGIYLGNGNVQITFDVGVQVLPLRFLRSYLIGVRRLI